MSRAARVAMLCVAGLLGACGEYRMIGSSCGPNGCDGSGTGLPVPEGCGQQFRSRGLPVPNGATVERCWLFTLDGLDSPPGDEHAYIEQVEVMPAPRLGHDLDLRIAPEIDDQIDGEVDCAELAKRAIPWVPLMTTNGGDTDEDKMWKFDAPLVASPSHRLFVNDSYTNLTGDVVEEPGATINVSCADSHPGAVSQGFEMTTGGHTTIPLHQRKEITANCSFTKAVEVTRLYRRTRLITRFTVERLNSGGIVPDANDNLPWSTDYDSLRDLDPAEPFAAGEGLSWSCEYENQSDLPLEIDGNSTDACSLFGIYQLPDGSEDPNPEHCRQH